MTRELTGKHVLFGFLGAFAVILTANLSMVYAAKTSFPGLVVKNSYVASQQFNGNQERAAVQGRLGWRPEIAYREGALTLALPENALGLLSVEALYGRPSTDVEDRVVMLDPLARGYAAPVALAPGWWRVEITATDVKGETYRAEQKLRVRE